MDAAPNAEFICEMLGVNTGEDELPAELWRDDGKLWVYVRNQGGHDVAGVCIDDVMEWLEKNRAATAARDQRTPKR